MKFSIRYKFGIGFLLIFCISFNLISLFINKIIISNNEKIVSEELSASHRDINIYFKQFADMNKIIFNTDDFEKESINIGIALSSKIDGRAILYSYDGRLLFDSDCNNGDLYLSSGVCIEDDFKDLNTAINEKTSYKIVEINKTYLAVISQRLYIDDNMIGILRYTKDYSELFRNSDDMMLKIKFFMLAIFFILFIFSFVLCTKIIIPIIKLNKVTNEISEGNFDIDININSNDEIGELAESFNIMKEKVKCQIEKIKKDRDDLIRSENSRKTFYNNVTHEIKTPLTIINGYAQMILDEEDLDKELALKAASKIKKESGKLHNMVTDILNMSKLESKINNDFKEKINMKNTIEKICSEMSIKAKKYEIKIEADLEQDLYLYANKSDINSMIINVIDNSIKYGNVKSTVTIKLFKSGNNINIVIEDKGKGMDTDILKNIFEPFYRGSEEFKNKRDGNGLGLSIVKSIVDKYNGKIDIKSEINKGTVVYIELPIDLQLGNNLSI